MRARIPSPSARVLLLLALAAPAAARAELVDAVAAVRSGGCPGHSGAQQALHRQPRLDEAASHLARGAPLAEAMHHAGYRAQNSVAIHVTGPTAAQRRGPVSRLLAERFCPEVTDPRLREIGVAQSPREAWIVLAEPFAPPAPADAPAIRHRVLELVNAARAEPRRCGPQRLPAAPPLRLEESLNRAALAHARDMAARGAMGHAGSDGSTPAERAMRAGYAWTIVGENVAAGPPTPEEAVQGWLASPGHCANLMHADFTEMGLAYAVNPASPGGIYWAQVLARPRGPEPRASDG